MTWVRAFLLFTPGIISITSFAQKNIKLASPAGDIVFSFRLVNASPVYNVFYKQKPVIENSSLSLIYKENGEFKNNLAIGKLIFKNGTDDYNLLVGKTRHVYDQYKEVTIPLKEKKAPFREIDFVVRVFNDGLAFRYEYPTHDAREP